MPSRKAAQRQQSQNEKIKQSDGGSASGSDSNSDSAPDEVFHGAPQPAQRMRRSAGDSGGSPEAASVSDVGTDDEVSVSASDTSTSASDDEVDVPLEELAAQHGSGGRAGPAVVDETPQLPRTKKKRKAGAPAHRENKNRPSETTSKRPIGRLRDVLQAPKAVRKDPRFEDLSGKYVPERFRKQYAFLYDEVLPQERSSLKTAAKKAKSADRKEQLTTAARATEARLQEDTAKQKKSKWEADLKAKERAAVRAGKKPFYLKKSDKRKAELVFKYEELKKSGKLERYLAKRRRRNAAKDHRYVPGGRRDAD